MGFLFVSNSNLIKFSINEYHNLNKSVAIKKAGFLIKSEFHVHAISRVPRYWIPLIAGTLKKPYGNFYILKRGRVSTFLDWNSQSDIEAIPYIFSYISIVYIC